MNVGILITVLIFFLVGFAIFLVISNRSGGVQSQTSKLMQGQRNTGSARSEGSEKKRGIKVLEERKDQGPSSASSNVLTLEKRLRYGRLNVPVFVVHLCTIIVSLIGFSLAVLLDGNFILKSMGLSFGPLTTGWYINRRIQKRQDKFDADYPTFLMQITSLLKTGMNTMSAIEEAAHSLEDSSLVREEVLLMLERLRYGVSEEKSIGAFGEDVMHSEIELFIQAVILSRRLGGNLSDTLERLSKSVRKRQTYRQQARGAVGMQRGSIYFILCIMVFLETYIWWIFPEGVVPALYDPIGWLVWQGGLAIIYAGVYWVNQVTKIKV
jgi:Flp pilus assembly protein TadB